jgi:hypothetical protein
VAEGGKMNKQKIDYGAGCTWLVENGAFALGMLLMFSKTVDLMTAFAPKTIFSYTGVGLFYGLACGFLIEGALLVMKLSLPRAKNPADWAWNVLVVIAPFLISAAAQIIDSFYVRDTLAQQPPEVQLFISYFVPSIPTLIMALFIGKSVFASIPEDLLPNGRSTVQQNDKKHGQNQKQAQEQAHVSNNPQHTLNEFLEKSNMTASKAKEQYKTFEDFAKVASNDFEYISGGNMRRIYNELNPTQAGHNGKK